MPKHKALSLGLPSGKVPGLTQQKKTVLPSQGAHSAGEVWEGLVADQTPIHHSGDVTLGGRTACPPTPCAPAFFSFFQQQEKGLPWPPMFGASSGPLTVGCPGAQELDTVPINLAALVPDGLNDSHTNT